MYINALNDLNKVVDDLQNQGKTDDEIKEAVKVYLEEFKKKINPNGDLDVV